MIDSIISALFFVTLIHITITTRLAEYIKALVIQGILIFILTTSNYKEIGLFHTLILGGGILFIKTLLIPYFIAYIIKKIKIKREAEVSIDNFYSMLIAIIIILISFIIAMFINYFDKSVNSMLLAVSIASMNIGLFIITSRKKIITHVMGYLIFENGIYLMSFALAARIPVIIETGVLLDVFIGVLMMGIFVNRIATTTESLDQSELRRLTDSCN
jgi:hydrogenase-4 component E